MLLKKTFSTLLSMIMSASMVTDIFSISVLTARAEETTMTASTTSVTTTQSTTTTNVDTTTSAQTLISTTTSVAISKADTTTSASTSASTTKSETGESTTTNISTSVTESTTTTAMVVQTDFILGDVNNNGIVDAIDASAVLTYYAMTSTGKDGGFTEVQLKAADFNNNGTVDGIDASAILSFYAKNSVGNNNTTTVTETTTATVTTAAAKRMQTFMHKAENPDSAVTEVDISFESTDNLQNTVKVESIMGKDKLCSEVVGLIGEPFSIETTSEFEKATISYKIDKSKLGETDFNDLMFLWYDSENDNFVELDTKHDEENSTVSVETTHFSIYPLVDGKAWIQNWEDIASKVEPFYANKRNKSVTISFSSYDIESNEKTLELVEKFYNDLKNYKIRYGYNYYSFKSQTKGFGRSFLLSSYNHANNPNPGNFDVQYENMVKIINDTATLDDWEYLQDTGVSGPVMVYRTDSRMPECEYFRSFRSEQVNHTFFTIGIIADNYFEQSDESILSMIKTQTYINSTANNKTRCFIIDLRPGNDQTLINICNKAGGKYFSTSEDNVEAVYNEILLEITSYNDADKDGFSDIEEKNGWIYFSNGTQIATHTNPNNKDTDYDGLNDGVEIESDITNNEVLTINGKIHKYYHKINSDPTITDTDRDGYQDIIDPYPLKSPDYLNQYDFLDSEIYYIMEQYGGYSDNGLTIKNNPSLSSIPVASEPFNKTNNQKFKFEWCGEGYKIHSLDNEELVLTIPMFEDGTYRINETSSYSVCMSKDINAPGQIWAVLPYGNNVMGLKICSKILSYANSDTVAKPLFLNFTDSEIRASINPEENTLLSLKPIEENWKRFGTIYMEQQRWIESTNLDYAERAFENYKDNLNVKDYSKNKISYKIPSGDIIELLVCQNDGAFINMYYGERANTTMMSKVICEVMATYNALKLKGLINNDPTFSKFLRMCAEFEINAMLPTPSEWMPFIGQYSADGSFGSDLYRIGNCINAYNGEYDRFTVTEDDGQLMDKKIRKNDVLILSYHVNGGVRFHTFAAFVLTKENMSQPANISLFNMDCNENKPTPGYGVYSTLNDDTKLFLMGYILK